MKKILVCLLMVSLATAAWAIAEREVAIVNAPEGSLLAGTLTMPDGIPKAALVLATGSGQQDRDETVFGHKPFKAIADRLGAEGYAVLRLDDRGVGGSVGNVADATTANFASDIGRAVEWADSLLGDIPVGVLGHSEGGQIALRVAASHPECRFIVTLAAPAWRGDSLIMAQCRALAVGALGRWDGEASQRAILDAVASPMAAMAVRPIVIAEIARTMGNAASMPGIQEYMMKQADLVLTPWYREFIRFDPEPLIRAVEVPWLALNGDKDTQVPAACLATIAELCPGAVTVELPSHNHLFQRCSTGLPTEYEQITEDISPLTLDTIVGWLDGIFAPDSHKNYQKNQ